MAAIYREDSGIENSENGDANEIKREDIQSAIAKAVELRALHAALMQGNSTPGQLMYPIASPVSHHTQNFSAQDYPVFTPSYEDEPMPGYQQILPENRNYAETWGEYNLNAGKIDETILSDYRTMNESSRNKLPYEVMSSLGHLCPAEDQTSVAGSCPHNNSILEASPGPHISISRRNSMGGIRSVSSCNRCKPAVIKSNIIVPLTDLHSSLQSQPRNKNRMFSWLFKKKNKNEHSTNYPYSEEGRSHMLKELGLVSVETLKKELIEAHETRDAALIEVSEMKSSLGDLGRKLEYLESYCEELKNALRQAMKPRTSSTDKLSGKRGKSVDENNVDNLMPVSDEVMVEGFLQIVSEARLSVKQFCKTLVMQIQETDETLLENLNRLLEPFKLSINSKYSKLVLYHLEAIINQSLYQDFENCVFQKNGAPKVLDPNQDRQTRFQSFVSLRNLSWNEVLRKGTKYYSDEFSKFCDQKMSGIIATLGWTRPWPEQLLQSFFVAAKCIWLLHLLAFSFNPNVGIMRVDENKTFEGHFMEDVFGEKKRAQQGPSRVKIMVMPGFYVHDRVLRCRVLCRYKASVV